MFDLTTIRSALLIAPHADDEALGAGGLLARLSDVRCRSRVLFMAVDGFHHYGRDTETSLQQRLDEIEAVGELLGFESRVVYGGEDLIEKLDTLPQRDLVDCFEREIDEFRPELVLLPHGEDYDQDHRACFQAGLAATRPIPVELGKHLAKLVVTYEFPKLSWTLTQFRPSLYVDIASAIDRKLESIRLYRSVLRSPPDVRSPEIARHLATLRGSAIGTGYAEGFQILRCVV